MILFGHLGIGRQLAQLAPWTRRWAESRPALFLLGTVLPDVIDKTLYYGVRPLMGWESLVSTRTFGHTGIFFGILIGLRLQVLALGVATHLVLDVVSDAFSGNWGSSSSATVALLYPLLGPFSPLPFRNLVEHFGSHLRWKDLTFEVAGLILFLRQWKARAAMRRG